MEEKFSVNSIIINQVENFECALPLSNTDWILPFLHCRTVWADVSAGQESDALFAYSEQNNLHFTQSGSKVRAVICDVGVCMSDWAS